MKAAKFCFVSIYYSVCFILLAGKINTSFVTNTFSYLIRLAKLATAVESDQVYRFSLPYLVLEKEFMILPAQKNHLPFCEKRKKRRIGLVIGKRMHCCRRSTYKISLCFVATEIHKLDGCTGLNSLHL